MGGMFPKALVYLLVFALVVSVIYAAEIKTGPDVMISEDETIDDNLYASGGNVIIKGKVSGDAIVAGGTIRIEGKVEDDIAAAGGSITIRDSVQGDVRVAGGTIIVEADVGGDMMAAGGQIEVGSDAQIGDDLFASGGAVTIRGDVDGDVILNGAQVIVEGAIAGNAVIQAELIQIGEDATIGGDLNYTSSNELVLKEGQVSGKVTRIEEPVTGSFANLIGKILGNTFLMLSFIFTGMVMLWILSAFTKETVYRGTRQVWFSLLAGFIALIITPIVALILISTLIALPVGLSLLFIYFLSMYLGLVIASIAIGRVIFTKIFDTKISYFLMLAVGVIIFTIITAIPYIGWIVRFVALIFGLGAIALTIMDYLFPRKKTIGAILSKRRKRK